MLQIVSMSKSVCKTKTECIKFLLIGKHEDELIFDEKVQINASTVIKLTHQPSIFQQNINIQLQTRFYVHLSTTTTIINIQIAEYFYYNTTY